LEQPLCVCCFYDVILTVSKTFLTYVCASNRYYVRYELLVDSYIFLLLIIQISDLFYHSASGPVRCHSILLLAGLIVILSYFKMLPPTVCHFCLVPVCFLQWLWPMVQLFWFFMILVYDLHVNWHIPLYNLSAYLLCLIHHVLVLHVLCHLLIVKLVDHWQLYNILLLALIYSWNSSLWWWHNFSCGQSHDSHLFITVLPFLHYKLKLTHARARSYQR